MECERKTVYKFSNGTVFNDLERPRSQISRSRQTLKLNISQTVRDRHNYYKVLIGTYTCPSVISNNIEWLSETFSDTYEASRGYSAIAELLV